MNRLHVIIGTLEIDIKRTWNTATIWRVPAVAGRIGQVAEEDREMLFHGSVEELEELITKLEETNVE